MGGKSFNKGLTIALVIIIAVVLGVLIYFTIDFIKTSNDDDEARKAAEQYQGEVSKPSDNNKTKNEINTASTNGIIGIDIIQENIMQGGTSSGDSNKKMYKGFEMVGTIEIPKTDLKLPVLAYASAKSIDVSVAVNGGPGLNKVGNTIIIGHNYRDGRFFANNKNISNGDKVYITDNSGTKIAYTVYNIYTTAPDDSGFMDRDTNGKREITLDTCTDDAKSRLIIWAKED